MSKLLTKTNFILYKECPNNVWVKRHKPEEYAKFEISEFEKSLGVMGNEVEELARGMFPGGYLVERRSEGAQELTQKLVSERTPVIFQAGFATDTYLAATDVLVWNAGAGAYDLYEIKMSSTEEEGEDGKIKKDKKKEESFEFDLAFQANVVEACGVKVNKKYLVRLNRQYFCQGDLDYSKLFILEDKTEAMVVVQDISPSHKGRPGPDIKPPTLPVGHCPCFYKGRSAQCPTFAFSNPD